MYKKYLFTAVAFILGLIFITKIEAQEKATTTERADVAYALYEYKKAADLYEHAYAQTGNLSIAPKLADCYTHTNEYEKALVYWNIWIDSKNATDDQIETVADLYKTLGKYEDAKFYYNEIRDGELLNQIVADKYRGCDSAAYWTANEKDKVYNYMRINSPLSDFCPSFISSSAIVFGSEQTQYGTLDMEKYTQKESQYLWSGHPFYKLYTVDSIAKGTEQIRGYNYTLNNYKWNVGPMTLSEDQGEMIITYTDFEKIKPSSQVLSLDKVRKKFNIEEHKLSLYISRKLEGQWTEPERAQIEGNGDYNMCHAAYGPNAKILYFASDMPGGYGGYDIWYSIKSGKQGWQKPINCGALINSAGDELFPYVAADGTLYFASDAHVGMGGLDIFRSVGAEQSWEPIANMQSPINSSYDDFGMSLAPGSLQMGFLTSNRPGGKGSDDIYGFILDQFDAKKSLDIYVYDKETQQPLPEATVTIVDLQDYYQQLSTDDLGRTTTMLPMGQTYTVAANLQGYRESQIPLSVTPMLEDHILLEVPLTRSLAGIDYQEGASYELKDLYYDFDQYYIRPDAAVILDELVALMRDQYPAMRILLSSHTDCRGTSKYNQKLSDKRAQSAAEYLYSHGIEKSRIKYVGMGESEPINGCTDGVPCSESDYQQNRRTEISVLKL